MTTHEGGCHCGAVRWTARTEIASAMECNCSICRKRGSLLHFLPAAEFTLERGEDALTDYTWNRHAIHHLFCRACGILSFARGQQPDGTPMVALNLRCVEALDLKALKIEFFDGASL